MFYSEITDEENKPQNTVWYSDIYTLEQEQKSLNDEKEMKELFEQKFPDAIWGRLQPQDKDYQIDNFSTYYFDRITNIIYSYNFATKYWNFCTEKDSSYNSYIHLFKKFIYLTKDGTIEA